MAGNDELDSWWDGLTGPERAEAVRAADAGQLGDGLAQSLENAGLITAEQRRDKTLPGDITTYLKMRH